MNKKEFCNYKDRAVGARKGIRAKRKTQIVKHFCQAFPERYNYNIGHGRTIARNCLVSGVNKYNLGTLKYKVSKGNGVPKTKYKVKDLHPEDIDIYQEIVEDVLKHHNISKYELIKRIHEGKEKMKNKKSMCSVFDINRKNIYRMPNGKRKKRKTL